MKLKLILLLIIFIDCKEAVAQDKISINLGINYYLPYQPWSQGFTYNRLNAIDVHFDQIPEIGLKYKIDSTFFFNYSYGLNVLIPESYLIIPAPFSKLQVHSLYFSKKSRSKMHSYGVGYQFVKYVFYYGLKYTGSSKGSSMSGPIIRINRALNSRMQIGLNMMFPVAPSFDILKTNYWMINTNYSIGKEPNDSNSSKLTPILGTVFFQEYMHRYKSNAILNNFVLYGLRYTINRKYFLQFTMQNFFGLDITTNGSGGFSNKKQFAKIGIFKVEDKFNYGLGIVEGKDHVRSDFRSSLIWEIKKFNPNNPFKGVFAAVGVPFAKNFEFQLSSDFYFTQRRIWEYDQLQLGVFYHLK